MLRLLLLPFAVILSFVQSQAQIEWTKHPGNPVFPRGASGSWDSQLALTPFVRYDGDTYQMWYSGYGGGHGAQIGYASSGDGTAWTRHPDPVLSWGASGSWDAVTVFQPCVLFEDTLYKMWFCGHNGLETRQIGYATSIDSIHWNKHGGNPVLSPGPPGLWDDLYVESPEVLYIDGVYHMWYSGGDGMHVQIGHATSPDGIHWTKDTLNPVLQVGTSGSWDDITVAQPSVVFDGTIYHMWYSGGTVESWDWKTGYAFSVDGTHWTKVSVSAAVLDSGAPGSWDDMFAGQCSVILDNGELTFKMWYGGGNGLVVGDIGYATAPLPATHVPVSRIAEEFLLAQNYPNPFNPSTTIRFELSHASVVRLSVFDLLGREVSVLVNDKREAGYHSVDFNASNLSSGVYFYRLTAGQFAETREMIVLK